jgi:hypothetical protein
LTVVQEIATEKRRDEFLMTIEGEGWRRSRGEVVSLVRV